jgi:hypothetical protein
MGYQMNYFLVITSVWSLSSVFSRLLVIKSIQLKFCTIFEAKSKWKAPELSHLTFPILSSRFGALMFDSVGIVSFLRSRNHFILSLERLLSTSSCSFVIPPKIRWQS